MSNSLAKGDRVRCINKTWHDGNGIVVDICRHYYHVQWDTGSVGWFHRKDNDLELINE